MSVSRQLSIFCADTKLLLGLASFSRERGAAEPSQGMKFIALKLHHVPGLELCWCCSSVRGEQFLFLPAVPQAQSVPQVRPLLWADTCLSLHCQLQSLEKSCKLHPSPTCGILRNAAWQPACTHTRLDAAVGARMRRNHKLPGQFPVTHLILLSVPPAAQSHRLEAGTRSGWVSKGNSSLKCTCLVALLYEGWFKSDSVQGLFYCSSTQVVFWLI